MKGLFISAAFMLAVTQCDQMIHQARYGTEKSSSSSLFPDGKALQSPPDGTVARDDPQWQAALRQRPSMTMDLLRRGQQRFGIYCAPCHDASGYGQGIVPSRGFPQPPSYHQARLRDAPSSYFVDVITHGHGVMFSYADRVTPADRWAIAAYLRALQLSQDAPVSMLSDDDKTQLGGGTR